MNIETIDILFCAGVEIRHCLNIEKHMFRIDMEGEALYYEHNLHGEEREKFMYKNPISERKIEDMKRLLNLR